MESELNPHLRGMIEALLFVSEKPLTLEQIREVVEGVDGATVKETIVALQKEYDDRQSGMVIVDIAGGYQMLSSSNFALAIRKFFKTRHKEKLSKPALETLAIIAYKQPVSRMDIELIRGVNSDGVTDHLLAKGLIKIVGRKDVPGRPFLYGTTKQFLEYFGLKSLDDLPKLEDFSSLQQNVQEIEAGGRGQIEDNLRKEESERIGSESEMLSQETNLDQFSRPNISRMETSESEESAAAEASDAPTMDANDPKQDASS